MKKILAIIYLGICVVGNFSSHKCNSNNIMNILWLNEEESTCLNVIFETTRGDFDFVNKKVAFLTGSSGSTISNKELYFNMQKQHSIDSNYPCDNGTLYIFDAVQKEESGGYDGAIVYWSKFAVIPIDKIVRRLKKKELKSMENCKIKEI